MSDPITQGAQAEAQGSESQSNQNGDGGNEVQTIPMDRFNEVIAKANKLAAGLEAQQGVIAQQQATIAALQAATVRPAAAEPPPPEVTPEDQEKINYYVNRALNPLMQKMESIERGLGQARSEPQIDKVEQKLATINNPVITARTREIMRDLKARGELGSLYTPDEVLRQAVGEFALGQLTQGAQNQNERQQYNGGGVMPLGQVGGGQRPKSGGVSKPAAVQKSIEDMTMQELDQYVAEQSQKYPEGIPF